MKFADRRDAGAILGRTVAKLDPPDAVVYALPRGGVPVGFEVARAIESPFDLIIVRKVGVPFQPELAMGAVAEGGLTIRNTDVIEAAGIDDSEFEQVASRERIEVDTRVDRYRKGASPVSPRGRTAIVVDDGLATGSTALAAVAVLQERRARSVWLAVPVAPTSHLGDLEERVDRLVVMNRPRQFGSVGTWYRDFTQTTDVEVEDLLARSRLP